MEYGIIKDSQIHPKAKIYGLVNIYGAQIGENTKVGTFVEIQSGVKIGKNSIIGSGVVLDRDIDDEVTCFVKSDLQIQNRKKAVNTPDRENLKKILKF